MKGRSTLLTSIVETHTPAGEGSIFATTSFIASGEPHAAAIVNAVIQNYGRPDDVEAELEERVGKRVTLILSGDTMLGATSIVAQEGTLFASSRGGCGLLPPGARKKGMHVPAERVLDVIDGWDSAEAQARIVTVRSMLPTLAPLTADRLHQLPGEGKFDGKVSLAVFGEWRMPDATCYDAVWLIGEYWPEDDICDRAVLLIRPEVGFSETGSVYGRQLLGRPVGEVVHFTPMDYREAVSLTDVDHDAALARIVGLVTA